MNSLYAGVRNSSDLEIEKYVEVIRALTYTLPVGMVLLRSDFSVLQCNDAANKYVGQMFSDQALADADDPMQLMSSYFVQLFRRNGLVSTVPLNGKGACSVTMTPFILSGNNGNTNTYYSVCIAETDNKQQDFDVREAAKQFGLSSREEEIVKLIVQGHSNQEIAETLFISIHTVKTHNENIFRKLGVKNRASVLRSLRGYGSRVEYAYG